MGLQIRMNLKNKCILVQYVKKNHPSIASAYQVTWILKKWVT